MSFRMSAGWQNGGYLCCFDTRLAFLLRKKEPAEMNERIQNGSIQFPYSNIGINKIESMLRSPNCPFVLYVGAKKLVKRREFEQFISEKLVI